MRTVTVSKKDCWNCGQNVNVATGDKDGEILEQDYFSAEEVKFAQDNGVPLERRFSSTAEENTGQRLHRVQSNPGELVPVHGPVSRQVQSTKGGATGIRTMRRVRHLLLSDSRGIHGL